MAERKRQSNPSVVTAFRLTIPERRLLETAAAGSGCLLSHWVREQVIAAARETVHAMLENGERAAESGTE